MDVGTNAEIVLGNSERLLACSSPTGPAFEGAQISGGQRAAPGAIERVRVDPLTLEPKYRVIGSELWSDDPAFAEAVGSSGVTGICGSGIIEVIAEMFLAGIISQDGTINGALQSRSDRIINNGRTFAYVLHRGSPLLQITQNDVRAIQLAKAALYAGVACSWSGWASSGLSGSDLAGAFGSHIDVKYAMVLGMMPDCDLEHVARPAMPRAPAPALHSWMPPRDRDRAGGAPGRENRDRHRTSVSGALCRCNGAPPQERTVSGAAQSGDATGTDRGSTATGTDHAVRHDPHRDRPESPAIWQSEVNPWTVQPPVGACAGRFDMKCAAHCGISFAATVSNAGAAAVTSSPPRLAASATFACKCRHACLVQLHSGSAARILQCLRLELILRRHPGRADVDCGRHPGPATRAKDRGTHLRVREGRLLRDHRRGARFSGRRSPRVSALRAAAPTPRFIGLFSRKEAAVDGLRLRAGHTLGQQGAFRFNGAQNERPVMQQVLGQQYRLRGLTGQRHCCSSRPGTDFLGCQCRIGNAPLGSHLPAARLPPRRTSKKPAHGRCRRHQQTM